MISIETRDTWSSATLAVIVGGVGPETFTPSAAAISGYLWAEELIAWLTAAGRGWAPASASWTWRPSSGLAVDLGRVQFGWVVDAAWSWVASATTATLVGLHNDAQIANVTYYATLAPWAGCVVPHSRGVWDRGAVATWSKDEGDAGSFGAVLPYAPGLTTAAIPIQGILQPVETTWLARQLRRASGPRRARIWDHLSSIWRPVALGAETRERRLEMTRVSLDVLTGPWS